MKIPYGNADFYNVVTGGYVYVDRTAYIRQLEETGGALLFLRPRRFGKSLWLKTLSCYYDLRYRDEHERLFGGLAIGRDPTEGAHRYFVLEWDFSAINPMTGRDDYGALLNAYVNRRIRTFLSDYRHHLPEPLELEDVAVNNLDGLLALIRQTPYRLYLLVDEYDNFANEVMMTAPEAYDGLVRADGSLKGLMKWVKLAMAGQGLERLFVTGVSPIVMSDVTSGFNICENVYLYPEFNALCGFTESDVDELLGRLHEEQRQAGAPPAWERGSR